MKEEIKIVAIGEEDFIKIFSTAGIEIVPCDKESAFEKVNKKIEEGAQIIFFTPNLYEKISPIINKYRNMPLPLLISLPVGEFTKDDIRIRELVKKALGVDILKEE